MNASKENASMAWKYLNSIRRQLDSVHLNTSIEERATFITNFLDAAHTKLPTEAAYDRDKQRRKKK